MYKETKLRTVLKTIVFKILTTSITACFTGLSGAIKIHIILTLVYLIHERLWNNIKWGKKSNKNSNLKIHNYEFQAKTA